MDIINQINSDQIKKLDKKIPDFAPGDTLRIGYKVSEGTRSRVQNYEGVVISRKGGSGISASFTVRKVSFGEGVERIFPLHSPNIDKITVVRRGKVRRAKLYYLRERSGRSARITEKLIINHYLKLQRTNNEKRCSPRLPFYRGNFNNRRKFQN